MTRKPTTIDEYLAALSKEKRTALEKLRKTIRAAAPKAEECISYQLPAFRLNGVLVGFGATANHCAFYLMSASTVAAHADELEKYDTSKGTIRFQADKPLPAALVRKLVKARIAENLGAEHAPSIEDQVQAALTWLTRHSTKRTRDGMARYGIPSDNALGVTVANIQVLGKRLGRNHELAAALWETGVYEARLLTAFVDDPAHVTPAQMDRWCRDFDSWAVCDTLCFKLFDQTPHAWKMYPKWCVRREEFERRAGFALLACLALHDKTAPDTPFLKSLPLIERTATDERNFVKKAVSWALRAVGRRSPTLHAASVVVARRLANSSNTSARWVGKDAFRELMSPAVTRRLAARLK